MSSLADTLNDAVKRVECMEEANRTRMNKSLPAMENDMQSDLQTMTAKQAYYGISSPLSAAGGKATVPSPGTQADGADANVQAIEHSISTPRDLFAAHFG